MSYMSQKQHSQVPTTLKVFVSRLSQLFIWLPHLWQYLSSNRAFGICEKGNPAHQVPASFLMIFAQKRSPLPLLQLWIQPLHQVTDSLFVVLQEKVPILPMKSRIQPLTGHISMLSYASG